VCVSVCCSSHLSKCQISLVLPILLCLSTRLSFNHSGRHPAPVQYDRMRQCMRVHVQREQGQMFNEASAEMQDQLKGMLTGVGSS
jgi:hypothetical protein